MKKKESSYFASCPEITDKQFQGDSLDTVFAELKKAIQFQLQIQAEQSSQKINQPIWKVAESLVQDMTEEELNQLPIDGAKQHDHYIYATAKK